MFCFLCQLSTTFSILFSVYPLLSFASGSLIKCFWRAFFFKSDSFWVFFQLRNDRVDSHCGWRCSLLILLYSCVLQFSLCLSLFLFLNFMIQRKTSTDPCQVIALQSSNCLSLVIKSRNQIDAAPSSGEGSISSTPYLVEHVP